MLRDLDKTIRELLIRKVRINSGEILIDFHAPDREWTAQAQRPAINCFLYDVRENLQLRETDWEVIMGDGTATRKQAPVRFDVTYQVSVWADEPGDEHELLWRVLTALVRNPILQDGPGEAEKILQGALRNQPFPIQARVAQPDRVPNNVADLWQAVENRIRPSLTYVVTVALDPNAAVEAPFVLTRRARVTRRVSARDTDGVLDAEAFEIGGRVLDRTDNAQGISGAVVTLREIGAETTTDEEGRFIFRRAPPGPITLVAQAVGGKTVTRKVTVPSESYDLKM